MKKKQSFQKLILSKKVVSKLTHQRGGRFPFPETLERTCLTNPVLCDPVSVPLCDTFHTCPNLCTIE
ncbi:hypothetical protein [Ascidiimonas aurantiaca]|uniref:hypothetical protein n=1 Tax=Ascidiimonas aurantiaca TaxID=1685432 RepID=UPI0030EDC052